MPHCVIFSPFLHLVLSLFCLHFYPRFCLYSTPVLFAVTSYSATKAIHPRDYVPLDEPIVFVIGAMAHGSVSMLFYKFLSFP